MASGASSPPPTSSTAVLRISWIRPNLSFTAPSNNREKFDKMVHELESEFTGEYRLRNNITGEEETVKVKVHDDHAAVFSTGVMDCLATVLSKSFDGKGKGRRKRKRDDDNEDPDAGKGGARNVFRAERGGNAFECYTKLEKDDTYTRSAKSEANAKKAAKKLQDCEATVTAFDGFVVSCQRHPIENGVWSKPYFETGKLDAKLSAVSSANLYPDKDLKAILLLLFPESGMLSKRREDKIAYIRDPKNFAKPWTKGQVDAELEAKRHELDGLRASAAADAEEEQQDEATQVRTHKDLVTPTGGNNAAAEAVDETGADEEDAEAPQEDAQLI